MRKVKNKKVIRKLGNRSFRKAKTRNIIAIIAIALTTMLFTTLFTLGIGTIENFQRQTMRQSGGDAHGVIKNLSPEEYEKIRKHPSIKEEAGCMFMAQAVENQEFLKRHVEIWYYPVYHYPHCFVDIIDGRAPEKANEILLDETSMELLGKKPRAGEQVTLSLRIRDTDEKPVERTFTVSGVISSNSALNVGFAIVSDAYKTAHADELSYTYKEDSSLVGTIRMDVSFSNSFSVQKKLDKIITDAGYSTNNKDANYIASNVNWAYVSDGAETDPLTVGAVAGGLLLIIFTGYLIIYNIFQISVIRDIQYYGLLKTIGTTGKQMKKIIRRQALLLSVIGIPFGLFFGYFIGKGIVPKMLEITSFSLEETVVSTNPLIFIGAVLFTLITVWISTKKPAKIAAKVSPVEAVRYTDKRKIEKKDKKSTSGGKIYKMALSNLGRNKKRTVLVVFSLSLAVILLNSVFTITHSFNMDKYLKKFASSDFLVGNAKYFNALNGYYGGDEEEIDEENLTESFVEYCKSLDGYQKGGRLYMTDLLGLQKDSWTAPDFVSKDENGQPGEYIAGEFYAFSALDDEHWRTNFYGMEDFFYSEIEVWKGESDPEIIKEKLKSGKYVLYDVQTDDNDFVEEKSVLLSPGDKIVLTCPDGEEREFEILSLIKNNYYGMSARRSQNFGLYTDASVFKEIVSDRFLMTFAFNADDDKEEAIAEKLEQYTTQTEPLMGYESKLYWLDQFSGLTGLFILIGGVLSFVVGIIGILNYINSILTGIVTRQGEFAMLEAIGMTRKQLTKMLILEGVYYSLATILFSLVLGCLFSFTALRILAEGMWFMKYQFTIVPMLIVFPVLLFLGGAVPTAAFYFFKKESVVERLRKYNG